MAVVALNSIYECKIGCWQNNQAGINVTYWECYNTAGTPPDDSLVAQGLDLIVAPNMKPLLCNTAQYYGVRSQRVVPAPRGIATVASGSTGVGTGGATPMSGQTTGVITLQTPFAGRKFRGRMYIPFPSTTSQDAANNRPTALYVANQGVLAAALTTGFTIGGGGNTASFRQVVFHKKTNTADFVTAYRANMKWGTQRKRGDYGQTNPFPPF